MQLLINYKKIIKKNKQLNRTFLFISNKIEKRENFHAISENC